MYRKLTVWLLAVLLLFGCGSSLAQEEGRELVLANPTKLSGHFFTDFWGSNTADVDVRLFVHGQGTIAYPMENRQTVNTAVVKSYNRTADGMGNVTYTFNLWEDLRFSDGSAVSARDFVGSVLLQAGSTLQKLSGAAKPGYAHLVGQDAFLSGQNESLAGVRLLGEHAFSLTIRASALPNYNELSLMDVIPYPMAVLLPEMSIEDQGEGAAFAEPLNAEALQNTLLGPSGYSSLPAVSFGPYQLKSYDRTLGEARFELNPYYKGDNRGQRPSIQRIRLIEADNRTMLGLLKEGQIDLINKVTWQTAIQEAKSAQADKEIQLTSYNRRGLAFLAVDGSEGPTSSLLVRKAIASLINREEIISSALRSNGVPVYGYYGEGQEMVQDRAAELKDILHLYPTSVRTAEELLSQDGWVFNQDGTEWKSNSGSPRFRKNGEVYEPLSLTLAISRGNPIAQQVATHLQNQLKKAGFELNVVELDSQDLFTAVYGQGDQSYDLTFMGSNFGLVFDPSYSLYAVSRVRDLGVDAAIDSLIRVRPNDTAAYLTAWDAFQRQVVAQLPVIPLYSNTYYDAYTNDLMDYHPENHASVALALLHARWRTGN